MSANENKDTSNETIGQMIEQAVDWLQQKTHETKETARVNAKSAAGAVQNQAGETKAWLDDKKDCSTSNDNPDSAAEWMQQKGAEAKENIRQTARSAAEEVEEKAYMAKFVLKTEEEKTMVERAYEGFCKGFERGEQRP